MYGYSNLNLQNMRAAVVQESGVMRDHDRCHVLQGVNVRLHPRHIDHIQVIGRLIDIKSESDAVYT